MGGDFHFVIVDDPADGSAGQRDRSARAHVARINYRRRKAERELKVKGAASARQQGWESQAAEEETCTNGSEHDPSGAAELVPRPLAPVFGGIWTVGLKPATFAAVADDINFSKYS
jgi:hypothetical protein